MTVRDDADRPATARTWQHRTAVIVSEAFSPVVVAYATLLVTGALTTQVWWWGAVLGVAVATLVAGLPYATIVLASRRGRLSGPHIPDRTQRPLVLVLAMTSAVIGLLFAHAVAANQMLTAVVVASIVGLGVAAAVSTLWKMSIHMAALGGATAIAAALAGPAGVGVMVVGGVVGWSRVRLRAHDYGQVVVGYLVGALVTGSVLVIAS